MFLTTVDGPTQRQIQVEKLGYDQCTFRCTPYAGTIFSRNAQEYFYLLSNFIANIENICIFKSALNLELCYTNTIFAPIDANFYKLNYEKNLR